VAKVRATDSMSALTKLSVMVCVLAAFAGFLGDCCAHASFTQATIGSKLKLNAKGTTLRVRCLRQTVET
jgi:hypothetical protein